MLIAVTGGTGYLGAHTVRALLAGGHRVRLLVGPDAYRYATAAGRELLATDEKWEGLSVSTAADDITNDQLDPLASGA